MGLENRNNIDFCLTLDTFFVTGSYVSQADPELMILSPQSPPQPLVILYIIDTCRHTQFRL